MFKRERDQIMKFQPFTLRQICMLRDCLEAHDSEGWFNDQRAPNPTDEDVGALRLKLSQLEAELSPTMGEP